MFDSKSTFTNYGVRFQVEEQYSENKGFKISFYSIFPWGSLLSIAIHVLQF